MTEGHASEGEREGMVLVSGNLIKRQDVDYKPFHRNQIKLSVQLQGSTCELLFIRCNVIQVIASEQGIIPTKDTERWRTGEKISSRPYLPNHNLLSKAMLSDTMYPCSENVSFS